MKRTIWKYELQITDTQTIEMPEGAMILTVQTQANKPCLWALVNPDSKIETRTFITYGTGHTIEEIRDYVGNYYIGSYQIDGGILVFHVFED